MAWLKAQTGAEVAAIQIVMEATGVYHQPLAYHLYAADFRVSVVDPARSKRFAESLGNTHKTDAIDSLALALFGCRMQPALWQPGPAKVRELKALLACLEALEKDLQRESNRLEKALFENACDFVITSLHQMIEHLEAEKKRLENAIDDHIHYRYS